MAKKKVRMLVDAFIDGQKYKPNQVVEFEDGQAKALVKGGQADDSKEAVVYAMSLPGAELVTHAGPGVDEPAKLAGEGGGTGAGAPQVPQA